MKHIIKKILPNKLVDIIKKYSANFLADFPVHLVIEVTNYCNLKCNMCPHGSNQGLNRDKGFMDVGLFRNIIRQCKERSMLISLFGVGEPLLHKDIIFFIKHAKESGKGLTTRLHTNATCLNKEFSKDIIESGLDQISFSFDGFNKETYEAVRKGAVYEKVLQNIIDFIELKHRLKSATPEILVQYIHMDNNDIQCSEESFLRLFGDYTAMIDDFRFIHAHSWSDKYRSSFAQEKEESNKFLPCAMLWERMVINWNGDVDLCCIDAEGTCILGNLFKDSIKSLWNGKKLAEIRSCFDHNRAFLPKVCKSCDIPYSQSCEKA